MQKITPFLWFDAEAEEAANYYVATFNHSRIVDVVHYGEHGPGPKGSVMTVTFELEGQRFMALNGGPHFHFTPAISLYVDCHTQEEVDRLWGRLSTGGEKERCGWLVDKFGVSWQIIPTALGKLLHDGKNQAKAQAVFQAMMQMTKLDVAELQQAYNQG
jgi:predicted 3-demethylubiquinone-9 3-methyltransferase (glyoxalase superfamily)